MRETISKDHFFDAGVASCREWHCLLRAGLRGLMLLLLWLLPVMVRAQAGSAWQFSGRMSGLMVMAKENFTPQKTGMQRLNLQLGASWHGGGRLSGHASLHSNLYTGRWLHDYPGFSFLTFNRYDRFDLTPVWLDNQRALAFSRLDRAYIDYNGRGFMLRAGRQLIGWGQTLIWNIGDIFNTFSLLEIDRMPRQGADAIRLAIYPTALSVLEVAASLNAYNDLTMAAMYRRSSRVTDWQWQTGIAEGRHWMVAGGFSTHAGKTGIRSEYGLFIPLKEHPTKKSTWLFTLGVDHIFANQLILQAEVLYNQLHTDEITGPLRRLYRSNTAPYMLSLSTWSMSVNTVYPINEKLRFMLMTLAFTDDKMVVISPSLQWQWRQNTEIGMETHYIALDYHQHHRQVQAGMLRLTHRF